MTISRINLFGGPGSGKTTLATKLFADLRAGGLEIEFAHEYIKGWAFEGRHPTGVDQLYIFAKQIRKEDTIFRGGVARLITDEPLMLVAFYSGYHSAPFARQITDMAKAYEFEHPSLNILLDRSGLGYAEGGRYQKEDEARKIDMKLKSFLESEGVDYSSFNSLHYDKLLRHVYSCIG